MMYDFHYPSGRGKLNEDAVNCRAEQVWHDGGKKYRSWLLLSDFLSLLCQAGGGGNGAVAIVRL